MKKSLKSLHKELRAAAKRLENLIDFFDVPKPKGADWVHAVRGKAPKPRKKRKTRR